MSDIYVVAYCRSVFTLTYIALLPRGDLKNPNVILIVSLKGFISFFFLVSLSTSIYYLLQYSQYTPCLKKTVKIVFCYNFVKFPPILIVFGTKMAKTIKLYKVYLFFTSPNLCQHTTVWNADAQIVTLHSGYLYLIAYFCIISLTEGATWFNNFVVLNILR